MAVSELQESAGRFRCSRCRLDQGRCPAFAGLQLDTLTHTRRADHRTSICPPLPPVAMSGLRRSGLQTASLRLECFFCRVKKRGGTSTLKTASLPTRLGLSISTKDRPRNSCRCIKSAIGVPRQNPQNLVASASASLSASSCSCAPIQATNTGIFSGTTTARNAARIQSFLWVTVGV